MSILIKGMEMPKNCDVCPLADTIICGAQGCPLIEVPPHGRLIDADKLLEHFPEEQAVINGHIRMGYAVGVGNVQDTINAAPTITDKEIIAEFLKQGTFKIHIPEAEPFTEPVKTGKWIDREVDHTEHMVADGTQTAKCSVCGKYHTTPYLYFFKDYAYCPNCGAKMDTP